jgi:ribosome-associated protein YbcJ (S4-like RNA binding protein)
MKSGRCRHSANQLINWVGSGGEAKYLFSEGHVLVNQAVETRKRKKIYWGDFVEFEGNKIRIGKNKMLMEHRP